MTDMEVKEQALISAVQKENLEEVERLTSELGDSLSSWRPSFDILCRALENKQLLIAKFLVPYAQLKLEPRTTTALHVAVLHGDVDVIQMIRDRFERGCRVCSPWDENEEGMTALHVFAHRRPVDQECRLVLDHLLKSHIGVNIQSTRNGYIPLHYAAECGNTDMISLLLSKQKTQINTRSYESYSTPLHLAVANGHTQAVCVLLQNGATSNLKTANRETPLCLAVKNQAIPIIQILLNSSYVRDPCSRISPFRDEDMLIYCAVESRNIPLVDRFLKESLQPNYYSSTTGKMPLHIAIEKGCIEIVKLLIRYGANLNAVIIHPRVPDPSQQSSVGFTVLHSAADNDQEEIFKFLLEVGVKPDAMDGEGRTPLHLATKNGSVAIVELLLKSGCNISTLFTPQKSDGFTPLHIAIDEDNRDLVERFLKLGIPVDSKTKYGFIPIQLAAQGGTAAMVQLLLKFGANASFSGPSVIETPLFFAAQYGCSEIVEIISEISTNRKNDWLEGFTSLYIAAFNGHESVVNILLRKGVDPNAYFEDCLSPLHAAAQKGHKAIFDLLLEKGANVNPTEKIGVKSISTPLLAALFRGHEEIVEILLNRGADVNVKINSALNTHKSELESLLAYGHVSYHEFESKVRVRYMPIHFAVDSGNKRIVEMLVEHGVDVNSRTTSNETPLTIAVRTQKDELVAYLLESGSNVGGHDSNSLLLRAISMKNLPIVELLLKFNAPLNFVEDFDDKVDVTPLQLAVMQNRADIVEAILKKGSAVDIETRQDFPLHLAIEKGEEDVIKMLIKYGACIDSECSKGLTPLLHALKKRNMRIVQLFLKEGVSFRRNTPKGVPLLHFAIDYLLTTDFIKFVVEFGANVNEKNEINFSPIQRVFDDNKENTRLNEPTHFTIRRNSFGNYECHCYYYGDEEDEDPKGKYDHDELLRLFLNNGFDVNTLMNETGRTILHFACETRNTKTVELLLQHDPDVNLLDEKGFTPFSYAINKATEAWNNFHLKLCSNMDVNDRLLSPNLDVSDYDNYDEYDYCSRAERDILIRNRDEYKKIARLMTQELAKLEAAGKEVHPENLVLLSKDTVKTYYGQCKKEIAALKEKKIPKSVSAFDVLVASENQLAYYAGNERIIAAMDSSNDISRLQFPLYEAELKIRFNRGVERRNLMSMTTGVLKDVLDIDFPCLIVHEILKYFKLSDFKNLCRARIPFIFVRRDSV